MRHISLPILFTIASICSCGQHITTVDNIRYNLENGEATIMAQNSSLSGDIIIPETISYNDIEYKVTNVADSAFKETKITSIILPNSIVSLGHSCFYLCRSLTSITLPNNLTAVGDYCFTGCTNLTSITLPNSITSLGNDCFWSCFNLTSITLPSSITALGNSCFSFCI